MVNFSRLLDFFSKGKSPTCDVTVPTVKTAPQGLVQLGEGAQGVVLKGTFENHPVVIKQAITREGEADIEHEACFLAKLQERLNNPPIPKLYGVTKKKQMISEWLQGMTGLQVYDAFVRNRAFETTFKAVIRNMVLGLQQLAHAGVVHNDIFFQNFLIQENLSVKIIDFGMASHTGEKAHRDFQLNRSAPEIYKGLPVTPAADIYSVGCVIYIMMTERDVFYSERDMFTIHSKLADKAIKLRKTRSNKLLDNPMLWDLLSRMLIPDPKLRITHEQILAHPYLKKSNGPSVSVHSNTAVSCQRDKKQYFCSDHF